MAQKGLNQAYEIQRRLKVWQPRRAAVVGVGTIGLLATLGMRLLGIEVTCYSRRLPPYFNSDLITELGAYYVSSQQATLIEASKMHGPFDIIFEASGFSPLAFHAAEALGKNGVLVLSSVTGGEKKVEVNADKINQGFVLGNKVMVGTVNASRADFVSGVNDLVKAEAFFPGWLNKLLTTRVNGLENYAEMLRHLTEDKEAIKVYIEVAHDM
jgi:glucose 1-dehydrogenase